jgi:hypothetical protein
MCGRGAMRDGLAPWNGFFAIRITPETNGLPKWSRVPNFYVAFHNPGLVFLHQTLVRSHSTTP